MSTFDDKTRMALQMGRASASSNVSDLNMSMLGTEEVGTEGILLKDSRHLIKYVAALIPEHDCILFTFKSDGSVARGAKIHNGYGELVGYLDAEVGDTIALAKGPFRANESGFMGEFQITFQQKTMFGWDKVATKKYDGRHLVGKNMVIEWHSV